MDRKLFLLCLYETGGNKTSVSARHSPFMLSRVSGRGLGKRESLKFQRPKPLKFELQDREPQTLFSTQRKVGQMGKVEKIQCGSLETKGG